MKNILSTFITLAFAATSQGANITLADPTPNTPSPNADGGIGYRWTVVMGETDSGTAQRHVGAWSWEDNSLFGGPGQGTDPVGWTHTSDWVALTLNTASTFTLRLERQAGVPAANQNDLGAIAGTNSMFPSFTIWSGWDADGGDHHSYNNRGNVAWAEDISYLDHLENSTLTAVERSWVLPAGNYSIVLGSNAPATDLERQGYLASFTTAPVPEPSVSLLGVLCLAGMLRRRR